MNYLKLGRIKLLTLQVAIVQNYLTGAVSRGDLEAAGSLAENLEILQQELIRESYKS